jgi:hypothetical protein
MCRSIECFCRSCGATDPRGRLCHEPRLLTASRAPYNGRGAPDDLEHLADSRQLGRSDNPHWHGLWRQSRQSVDVVSVSNTTITVRLNDNTQSGCVRRGGRAACDQRRRQPFPSDSTGRWMLPRAGNPPPASRAWVSSWLTSGNEGLLLNGPLIRATYYQRTFSSRQRGTNPPSLVVTYHLPTCIYLPLVLR